jgi:diguanylate cyclase (GGDEF)-like protein
VVPLRVDGFSVDDLLKLAEDGSIGADALTDMEQRLRTAWQERRRSHFMVQGANEQVLSVNSSPLADGGLLVTFEDVTEQRRALARIEYMARHDGLTNLPNRVLLRERLEAALHRAGRGQIFALFCLDMDGFKAINDQYGHAAGDRVLQLFATRLQRCVREVDTVARLGGDEFAIIQAGIGGLPDAMALAARLAGELALPYDALGRWVNVGASIGIALGPRDGTDPDSLLNHADLALYRAKSEGKSRMRLFAAEMDSEVQRRRNREADLRRGVEAGEFEPHYQPLVSLATNRVCGFEALARWRHPGRGLLMPAEFIQLAEEIGLIADIGESILRRACRDALAWPSDLKVAVNLSPVQFGKSCQLVAMVREALAESGMQPERLELEITESVLLHDNAEVMEALQEIRALGVSFALDDFGTGYSSLSYLRRFPFGKVKIDRCFVQDIGMRAESDAIIHAVAELGRSLGMIITAEGVENGLQARRLAAHGCTEGQGYLYSPALPNDEALAFALRTQLEQALA